MFATVAFLLLGAACGTEAADALRWITAPASATAGLPFPVSVQAEGSTGLDAGFVADVQLSFLVDAPPAGLVLQDISSGIQSGVPRVTVQIVNAGTEPAALSGELRWYGTAAPFSLPDAILPLGADGGIPPVVLQPGEVVRLSTLTNEFSGRLLRILPAQAASFPQPLAALALAQAGQVLDLWVGRSHVGDGGPPPPLGDGTPAWTGPGVSVDAPLPNVRRRGAAITRTASDWSAGALQPGAIDGLPLAPVPKVRPVSPAQVHLSGGRWEGSVQIDGASPRGRMLADDLGGRTGLSPSIEVAAAAGMHLSWDGASITPEGGAPLVGRVTLASPALTNQLILLSISPAEGGSLPASVLIGAGALSGTFGVVPSDDGVVAGGHPFTVTATAPGWQADAPLQGQVVDGSRLDMVLTLPSLVAASKAQTPFQGRLQLNHPVDRDVVVAFETAPPATGWSAALGTGPQIQPAIVYAGRDFATVTGTVPRHPLINPTRFTLRAAENGWRGGVATMLVQYDGSQPALTVAPAVNGLRLVEGTGTRPGTVLVSLNRSSASALVVQLSSSHSGLLAVPALVEIPAFTSQVTVPVSLGRDGQVRGTQQISVVASAEGVTSGLGLFNVVDSDFDDIYLDFGQIPNLPVVLPSGVPVQMGLLTTSIGWWYRADYNGPVAIELDSTRQTLSYVGPSLATMKDGYVYTNVMFVGEAKVARLKLTLPDGRSFVTLPVEVVPQDGTAQQPTHLSLIVPASAPALAGEASVITGVVSNAGPVLARRVLVTSSSTDPVLGAGGLEWNVGIGSLAPGESAVFSVPWRSTTAGTWGVRLGAGMDNPDTAPDSAQALVLAVSRNPDSPDRIERVIPNHDMVISPISGRAYVSVASPGRSGIQEVDPSTGALLRFLPTTNEVGALALSADATALFAAGVDLPVVSRINVTTWKTEVTFGIGALASDVSGVPKRPDRVVVAYAGGGGIRLYTGSAPTGAVIPGTAWVDLDDARTNVVAVGDAVRFSADGSTWNKPVTDPGIIGQPAPGGGFRALGNRVYYATGDTFSGAGVREHPYPVHDGVDVCVDGEGRQLFFLTGTTNASSVIAFSLDATNPPPIEMALPWTAGPGQRLARWGTDGLAFRTPSQLTFFHSPLVASGESADVGVTLQRSSPDLAGPVVCRVMIRNAGPGVARNPRVAIAGAGAVDAASQRDSLGRLVVQLPDLQPGDFREFTATSAGKDNGLVFLTATAFGGWTETNPADNLAGLPALVNPDLQSSLTMDVEGPDVGYDAADDLFLIPFRRIAQQRLPGILAVDARDGQPAWWVYTGDPLEKILVSPDGTVSYLVLKNGTEIRRLRSADRKEDLRFSPGRGRKVSDLLMFPGRNDLLVVARNHNNGVQPAWYDVAAFQDGVALTSAAIQNAGSLARAAADLEFYGGSAESTDPRLSRFKVDASGVSWLGYVGTLNPLSTRFTPVSDYFLGSAGDVHRISDGVTVGNLWPSWESHASATVPGSASRVIRFESNRLEEWDVLSGGSFGGRFIADRPLASLAVAASPSGAILAVSNDKDSGFAVLLSTAKLEGQRPVLTWDPPLGNERVGGRISTTLTVGNPTSEPLRGAVVSLETQTLSAVGIAGWTAGPGVVVEGSEIRFPTIPAGGSSIVSLDFTAEQSCIAALSAQLRTTGFDLADVPPVGPTLRFRPNAAAFSTEAVSTGVTFGIHDLVYAPAHREVWAAHYMTRSGVWCLDLDTRSLVASVPVPQGWEPRHLAVSDDETRVYLSCAYADGILRINARTGQTDGRIPLASPDAGSEALLAVRPGDPNTLALVVPMANSTRLLLFNGSAYGRAGLDVPGAMGVWFVDANTVVVASPGGLTWAIVTADGLSATRSIQVPLPYSVPYLAGDRLYFSTGEVHALNTGERVFAGLADVLPRPSPAVGLLVGWAIEPGRSPAHWVARGLSTPDLTEVWRQPAGEFQPDPRQSVVTQEGFLLTALAGGGDGYPHLLISPVASLATPESRLALSLTWSNQFMVAGVTNRAFLTVSNAGGWNSSQIGVLLPPDFAAYFSGLAKVPGAVNATIAPGGITIPALGAGQSVKFAMRFSGRAQSGDYVPAFSFSGATPPLASPAVSTIPPVRVVPLPVLSILLPSATEGNATTYAPFTLRLSGPSPAPVIGQLAVVADTAIPGLDFLGESIPFNIPPGKTEWTNTITILGDTLPEPVKRLGLRLDSLSGATPATNLVLGLLFDDDLPALGASDAMLVEGHSGVTFMRFEVQLGANPLSPAKAAYVVQGLGAATGEDFLPTTGVLSFPTGQRHAVVEVGILGDRLPELPESLRLVLTPLEGLSPDRALATGTILNDDADPVLQVRITTEAGRVHLRFPTVQGVDYQLERAEDINGPWVGVGSRATGTGRDLDLTDSIPSDGARFYRASFQVN